MGLTEGEGGLNIQIAFYLEFIKEILISDQKKVGLLERNTIRNLLVYIYSASADN